LIALACRITATLLIPGPVSTTIVRVAGESWTWDQNLKKRKRKLQAPSFKQQAMLDNGSGIV